MGPEAENGSLLKRTLKSLCVSNGWSYGVFWRFDQRNPMLLSVEDAYYEERVETVIDNMLIKVHMLGEGTIGQTAFNGKHKWILADGPSEEWNSFRSTKDKDAFQDDSEVCYQFSCGIKTIAVIPVEPRGLVQFGSTDKISERLEFVDQTMRLFREIEKLDVFKPLENTHSCEKGEPYDINGLFASLTSSRNSNNEFIQVYGGNYKEPRGNNCSAMNSNQCSPSTSDIHCGNMGFSKKNAAYLDKQPQAAGTEADVFFSDRSIAQFEEVIGFKNDCADKTSCISSWSGEYPILPTLNRGLASESKVQDSADGILLGGNLFVSCRNAGDNIEEDATFSSLYNAGALTETEKYFQAGSGNLMDNQQLLPSNFETQSGISEKANSLDRFPEELFEEFKLADFTADIINFCQLDDLSQWFASIPEHSSTLNGDLTQFVESTSTSSCLAGGDKAIDQHPTTSVQSYVTHTLSAEGQQKSAIIQSDENDTINGRNLSRTGERWEDIIMPLVAGDHPTTSSASGKWVSGFNPTPVPGPRKGLFSELGLDELLVGSNNSSCLTKSNLVDESSPLKRRRVESSSVISNQAHFARFAGSNGDMSLLQYNLEKTTNNLATQKELPKSQVGLWIDDSYSIIGASAVLSQPQKPEEHKKVTRKRARPGESTRPRPKDRQLIQDRIKELRGIIPSGGKCSIDSLLDRTIKYMLFLQGVMKYADKLKQSNEPKLISKDNGVVLRDNSISNGAGGVTWAFEVGGQSMVCPIIVEDLSPPGQMLIEMLCEEQGFFLEIADIIRGFGLSILKGVMEVRGNKIWAHFIVEASSHVTRIDVFLSLVRLLQQTSTDGIDSANQPSNVVMDVGIPLLDSYQKPNLPPSICLTETLH
ncbi:MYC/MYB transcription factor [Parasponia andersonii]|uniref:MYC/MYB transcription factor n=1 Tax=Parasponia andersonii TaxID=3476 RepID=A0A2P5DJY5_PARAD|nr:MYC/MYB transcription factor [Parasponia andersonii]